MQAQSTTPQPLPPVTANVQAAIVAAIAPLVPNLVSSLHSACMRAWQCALPLYLGLRMSLAHPQWPTIRIQSGSAACPVRVCFAMLEGRHEVQKSYVRTLAPQRLFRLQERQLGLRQRKLTSTFLSSCI